VNAVPINCIHWDDVARVEGDRAPADGHVWVIWPSPVNHDACFAAAGFTDFCDPDDEWDRDFTEFLDGMFAQMSRCGEPRLVAGGPRGWWPWRGKRPRDRVLAATNDDHEPPCEVHFGVPPAAILWASDGHSLLWIWTANVGIDGVLTACAGGREVRRCHLDWQRLGWGRAEPRLRRTWWPFGR
jgi:hypothetical protein